MNMLKKGPEIKLSSLKVPDFLQDVYFDLRERHLLPVVALLVVAAIAVPILLGQSSEPELSSVPGVGSATSNAGGGRQPVVFAKSAPGLRDYRRRLRGLKARNPFIQQYTSEAGSESSGEGGNPSATEGGGGVTITSESGSTAAGAESGGFESGGGGQQPVPGSQKLKYYSYAIDVRVVPVSSSGKKDKSTPSVRRNLPELTMLPSRQMPALVFVGPSSDAKKAIMLVSTNVQGIFGDAVCVLGTETCQMLALEPGIPETFVYGGNEKTFRITLLKIRLLETDKLNRAPLGEPKKKQQRQSQSTDERIATGSPAAG
jgi:hypothetical protein